MSNITGIHNALITRIQTVLPSRMRLYNPYEVSENPAGVLQSGFGIALGEGTNSKLQLSCRASFERTFRIILTGRSIAIDSDAASKADNELSLFEDQLLLIQDFCDNSDLPGTLGIVEYESDSGIERVFSDKDSYLVLTSDFSVKYFESL